MEMLLWDVLFVHLKTETLTANDFLTWFLNVREPKIDDYFCLECS